MTEDMQDWIEGEEQSAIAELKELSEKYWELKTEAKDAENLSKNLGRLRDEVSDKIQAIMTEEGLTRFDSDNCFVTLNEESYVTTPQTATEKKALFDWLTEKGVFYDYATINYQSLQSLYKAERNLLGEEEEETDPLPGVGPMKTRIKLRSYKQK